MRETFKQISVAFGAEPAESKNPIMDSYKTELGRVNYYFTTGTVTFQSYLFSKGMNKASVIESEDDIEQFYESII